MVPAVRAEAEECSVGVLGVGVGVDAAAQRRALAQLVPYRCHLLLPLRQRGVATMLALQKLPRMAAQPGGSLRLMSLVAPASRMLLNVA